MTQPMTTMMYMEYLVPCPECVGPAPMCRPGQVRSDDLAPFECWTTCSLCDGTCSVVRRQPVGDWGWFDASMLDSDGS